MPLHDPIYQLRRETARDARSVMGRKGIKHAARVAIERLHSGHKADVPALRQLHRALASLRNQTEQRLASRRDEAPSAKNELMVLDDLMRSIQDYLSIGG